jgi:hypothetical protein
VDSGVNLYLVKEILGHADFKMTTRYSHPARDSIRKAMKSLEKRDKKAAGAWWSISTGDRPTGRKPGTLPFPLPSWGRTGAANGNKRGC